MATCSSAIRQLLLPTETPRFSPPATSKSLVITRKSSSQENSISFFNVTAYSSHRRTFLPVVRSSPGGASIEDDDGVSLGTMKLPLNTDIPRFETLLFQWANSLCQGANIPLPLPLKIDKIQGGVRLGFVTVGDGETEIVAYIDCLVFPGSGDSGPFFRATRNGAKKDRPPPGEPRIMKSLLGALQKSVQIARV